MKKAVIIFYFLLVNNFTAISQNSQLFDYSWYLQSINYNNVAYIPPVANDAPFIRLDYINTDTYSQLSSQVCNAGFAEITYSDTAETYILSGGAVLTWSCSIAYFENFYFFDFLLQPGIWMYEINDEGSSKTLTITSNQNDFAIYSSQLMSTTDNQGEQFILSPNPTANYIEITGYKSTEIQVEIYNILGQKLLSKTFHTSTSVLDLPNFSKGTYIMKISSGTSVTTKKFIKI